MSSAGGEGAEHACTDGHYDGGEIYPLREVADFSGREAGGHTRDNKA